MNRPAVASLACDGCGACGEQMRDPGVGATWQRHYGLDDRGVDRLPALHLRKIRNREQECDGLSSLFRDQYEILPDARQEPAVAPDEFFRADRSKEQAVAEPAHPQPR